MSLNGLKDSKSQTKKPELLCYKTIDPLTNSEVLLFKWKHCRALVYENDEEKWATVSFIETHPKFRNQGEATELLNILKYGYEIDKGYDFGGTVALNPAMKRVYEKTGVKEYEEDYGDNETSSTT